MGVGPGAVEMDGHFDKYNDGKFIPDYANNYITDKMREFFYIQLIKTILEPG